MEENTASGNTKLAFLFITFVICLCVGIIALFDTQLTAWHYSLAFYILLCVFFVSGYFVFSNDVFDKSNIKQKSTSLEQTNVKIAKPEVKIDIKKVQQKPNLAKQKEFERKRGKRKGLKK
jgi:Ca2+/Na+ antiporter